MEWLSRKTYVVLRMNGWMDGNRKVVGQCECTGVMSFGFQEVLILARCSATSGGDCRGSVREWRRMDGKGLRV